MPAFRLGPSESGGYRNVFPEDPEPPSKVGALLTYVFVFALGLIVGGLACTLLEDRTARSSEDKVSAGQPSL